MKIYIDEAGRWPLAGPLYVGLVLPIGIKKTSKLLKDFKDSKVLNEKKREELYEKIVKLGQSGKILFASGNVSNIVIDKIGLTKSINYAIRRGITVLSWDKKSNCSKRTKKSLKKIFLLDSSINFVSWAERSEWKNGKISLFVDWKFDFNLAKDLDIEVETLVKADQKNVFVSMASIIAKVERDRVMVKMAKKYPNYGFEKHKWYGTEFHREMIEKYGVCKIHRKLFLRKMFEK